MLRLLTKDAIRFWQKIDVKTEDECWEWKAAKNYCGNGRFHTGGKKGKVELAHRVSFTLFWGEIVEGLFICHKCDNPGCVNYFHLFAGTHTENMLDRQIKGRGGHVLTKEEVNEIRFKYNSGVGHTYSLAEEYGVHQSVVWRIVTYRIWKHI